MNPVEPVTSCNIARQMPRKVAGQWLRPMGWVILALLAHRSYSRAAGSVEVQPAQLVFSANIDDPVVLRLEVKTTEPDANVDLRAVGLRVQREVRKIDSTRRVFLIEPDTTKQSRVNGQIDLVDQAGAIRCSVPITGEVKSLIHASPTRIFLGALEYGAPSTRIVESRVRLSANTAWKITDVDASELPDAQWEVQNEANGDKEVRLRFPEDAFKANVPFGAFIKRSVRIKTDNRVQPEVVIAVEGMLARNATKRNFNTFVFRGNERWQGRWSTPNLAAAVVSPLVLLLLGYGVLLASTRRKPKLFWWTLAVVACLGATFGMALLAKTYSRGGWVSFGTGLGLMMLMMKRQRIALGVAGVAFVGLIAFLPAGMQRAVSSGAIGEDPSISHRLLVWRGALEMIADHPIHGVGAGQFGQIFQTYYQEPWHKDQYTTAISDYLTFAAERGGVITLGIIIVVTCLAAAAIGYSRRYGDVWLVPVIGALLTLGTSSIFSSLEFVWEDRFLNSVGVATLAVYGGLRFALERRGRRAAKRIPAVKVWFPAAGAGLSVGCLLGGVVVWAAWARSARCPAQPDVSGTAALATRIEYLPGRRVPSRGTLLFLPSPSEPLTSIGRQVLRPLAEGGWRAVALNLPMYDQEATGQVVEALHGLPNPSLVLAEGARARVAVAAGRLLDLKHRPKMLFIEPVFFSALEECDQSAAAGITPSVAVIAGKRWQAFKRDGQSGLNTMLQACDAPTHDDLVSDVDHSREGPAQPEQDTLPMSAAGR